MQVKQLDTQEAKNKFFAYKDAVKRSSVSQELYSKTQQREAKQLHEQVRQAFMRSRVYLTYRDSFYTVKVDKPTAADKISSAATKVEKLFDELGAEKAVTAQGIIYRIKRR